MHVIVEVALLCGGVGSSRGGYIGVFQTNAGGIALAFGDEECLGFGSVLGKQGADDAPAVERAKFNARNGYSPLRSWRKGCKAVSVVARDSSVRNHKMRSPSSGECIILSAASASNCGAHCFRAASLR